MMTESYIRSIHFADCDCYRYSSAWTWTNAPFRERRVENPLCAPQHWNNIVNKKKHKSLENELVFARISDYESTIMVTVCGSLFCERKSGARYREGAATKDAMQGGLYLVFLRLGLISRGVCTRSQAFWLYQRPWSAQQHLNLSSMLSLRRKRLLLESISKRLYVMTLQMERQL